MSTDPKRQYGNFECGVLFLRAFKKDNATCIFFEDDFIFLPPLDAPGLGELIRGWIAKTDNATLSVYRKSHKISKELDAYLKENRQSIIEARQEDNEEKAKRINAFIEKKVGGTVDMLSALQKSYLETQAEKFMMKINAPPLLVPSLPTQAGLIPTSSSGSSDDIPKVQQDNQEFVVESSIDSSLTAHYVKHICRRAKQYYIKNYCAGTDDKSISNKEAIKEMLVRIQQHCFYLDKQEGRIPHKDWKSIYNYTNTFLIEEDPSTLESEEARIKQYLTEVHERFLSQHGRVKGLTKEKEGLTKEKEGLAEKLSNAEAFIREELMEIDNERTLLQQSLLKTQSRLDLVGSQLESIDSASHEGKLDFNKVGALFFEKGQLENEQKNLKEKIDGLSARELKLIKELSQLGFAPKSPHDELDSPPAFTKTSPASTMEIGQPSLSSSSTKQNEKNIPLSPPHLSLETDVTDGVAPPAPSASLLASSMHSVIGSLNSQKDESHVSAIHSPPCKKMKLSSPDKEHASDNEEPTKDFDH